MRFMLLMNYGEVGSGCAPMTEWSPGDIKAHIDFQHALNTELTERGELVDAQGLAGPDQAKSVMSDGSGAPVITDGPFPESKELLAGYRLVDVETMERAIEIAAQTSAAPGPQRISRAKAKLKASDEPFRLPSPAGHAERLDRCCTSSTSSSTRATPPAAGSTWPAGTCRARPSAWPGSCTAHWTTTPTRPASSPSCS